MAPYCFLSALPSTYSHSSNREVIPQSQSHPGPCHSPAQNPLRLPFPRVKAQVSVTSVVMHTCVLSDHMVSLLPVLARIQGVLHFVFAQPVVFPLRYPYESVCVCAQIQTPRYFFLFFLMFISF